MKRLLLALGRCAYWAAWPVFFVYLQFSYGRTRVVVHRGDKILVVKQWVGTGKWQLPGGGMHKNEPVVLSALRELREETGLALEPGQLTPVGKANHRSHGAQYAMHVFTAAWPEGDTRLQRFEIADAWWARPGELNKRNSTSDTLVALQMIQ